MELIMMAVSSLVLNNEVVRIIKKADTYNNKPVIRKVRLTLKMKPTKNVKQTKINQPRRNNY